MMRIIVLLHHFSLVYENILHFDQSKWPFLYSGINSLHVLFSYLRCFNIRFIHVSISVMASFLQLYQVS